ncbi:AAA family ATPase [Vibrio scophthalmi]|uniref:SPOR domain-containing protein n=1 Tax=Vibrio scophthalmi TaxID=45658 RepID=UPI0038735D89
MSFTHQSRVLELDSQIELLERLQLLTHFNSNFVCVSGVSGAGKTWLAQRYLEAWADDKNQALLMCHPNQNDEQHRTTILTQVLSEPLFNPADNLAESFSRCMAHEPCDVVIVVDNAHLLSETLVSELWLLALQAQHQSRWTLNIILFAEPKRLDSVLTRLSRGQEFQPVDLDIEPLTSQEAGRFFEQLVVRFVEDDMERRVRNAYRTAARRPGVIMALGEQKVEKRIIVRSIVGSPFNIALVVLVLLALISGGYWWMMSQPTPGETAEKITSQLEQTVIPTINQPDATVSDADESIAADNRDETESELSVDPSFSGAEDDSAALPPEVVDMPQSVGVIEDNSQRVVITSEVVDALIESESDQVDTSNIEQVVDDSRAEVPVVSEAPAKISFSFAKDELNSFSPRSYTLQLAAVNNLAEAQNFLNRYDLDDKVYVYPALRSGVEWYIITYDNFPTIQLARDAVVQLPEALQKLSPWAKSLNQVQREIARTN